MKIIKITIASSIMILLCAGIFLYKGELPQEEVLEFQYHHLTPSY